MKTNTNRTFKQALQESKHTSPPLALAMAANLNMHNILTPTERKDALSRFAEIERNTRLHQTPTEIVARINYARTLGGREPITVTQYVRALNNVFPERLMRVHESKHRFKQIIKEEQEYIRSLIVHAPELETVSEDVAPVATLDPTTSTAKNNATIGKEVMWKTKSGRVRKGKVVQVMGDQMPVAKIEVKPGKFFYPLVKQLRGVTSSAKAKKPAMKQAA